jgi:large subunit ribosomal protein L1
MAEAKKAPKVQKKATAKKKQEDEKNVQLNEAEVITKAAPAKKAKKEIKEAEVIAEAAPLMEEKPAETTATAKAGKRSAKAVKQVQEKEAKQARKSEKVKSEAVDEPKKPTKNPTRPKAERAGKKYREATKLIEDNKVYNLAEALSLATKTSPTKFDGTVELHINLGVDPRQADQNVRGTVGLPEGTGKNIRVAVICEEDDDKKASGAGADLVGADKILAALEKEQIEFDILISTPSQMSRLAKYARLLGPKGLMPNPKSGTVTADVAKAVKKAKAGRVEYRVDSAGIIHLGIGKVSFGADRLAGNANVIIDAIKAAKPASLKGSYIKAAHISTTMGPSIKTQIS